MNIQIKRNTFVAPDYSRKDIVQKICDKVVQKIEANYEFRIELQGAFPRLYLGTEKSDPTKVIITTDPYQSRYDLIQIRSCEMRLVFRLMQDAGYYAYKWSDGWQYCISNRPYNGLQKAERVDFTSFID